jgi:ring-1,2-phenylacetyl-CoA epoxidase subunit PaaC
MHVIAWITRLATGGEEPRRRLEAALLAHGIDASTVFTPLEGEAALLEAGILARPLAAAEAAWRADLTTIMVPLGLALPPAIEPAANGRRDHSDAFDWLWSEFTMVRRSENGVTW